MKRFLALYITPIIGVTIVLLHLPRIEEYLNSIDKEADFYIAATIVILGIVNHFITVFSPLRKYKKLEKEKWVFINYFINNQIIPSYSHRNISIQFNVMKPKRVLFHQLEIRGGGNQNSRKWRFFARVFKFEWKSKNSNINKKLVISINQGVAGNVFNTGLLLLHNFANQESFGLNEDQVAMTSQIKVIISAPIEEDDEHHSELKQTGFLALLMPKVVLQPPHN